MKATSAICGPNDDIRIPRGAETIDSEVELGVIIGREARDVPYPQALRLRLEVYGRRRHDGTTATMAFGVATLVSYISEFMSL